MSIDTVDDLHAAESQIGLLRHTLDKVVNGPIADTDARVLARVILSEPWCRPSCELDDDGTYLCDEDCGCPCRHPAPCSWCLRMVTTDGEYDYDETGSTTCETHVEGCKACDDGESHPHQATRRGEGE